MATTKGLLVSIYKNGCDCTNHGITSKISQAVLIGQDIPEIFSPSDDSPALYLVKREKYGDYISPFPEGKSDKWFMFGGNFAYTSDSRFPSRQPIAIHDRTE